MWLRKVFQVSSATHAVVLVPVLEAVGEDQVRAHARLQRLEVVLQLGAAGGEVAAAEARHLDLVGGAAVDARRRVARLRFPHVIGGEHQPLEPRAGKALAELGEGPAAADLDVVAVGAEAEDVPQPAVRKGQGKHDARWEPPGLR